MPDFADFMPLPSNQSEVNLENAGQPLPSPSLEGSQPGGIDINDDKQFWNQDVETSLATKMQPQVFDWEKSRAERYTQDQNFKNLGFNPYSSPVVGENGAIVDANEEKYDVNQTFSNAIYKGIVGGGVLFADTFIRQAESWWDLGKGMVALASGIGTGHAWADAQRAYIGSDEELLQFNKEQEAIMNKYAVFQGSHANSIWTKEFLANSIQQFGLGAGQTAEMLAEVFATMGVGAAFDAVKGAAALGKLAKTAQAAEAIGEAERFVPGAIRTAEEIEKAGALRRANGVFTPAEQIARIENLQKVALDIQKMSDLSKNKALVSDMWSAMSGVKKIMPGSGIFDIGSDIVKVSNATGESLFKTATTNWAAWKGGVGSLARDLSMFNMASTHGKLLAFTTYGQQYADLMDQYEREHGVEATGEDLEVIKNNAWMAAKDVFTLNVPLIMLMGKIEWGMLFSKFSTSGRALRGLEASVAEGGEASTFTVKGRYRPGATLGEAGEVQAEKIGKVGLKDYEKVTGMFPAIRTLNMVRKDFGLGTALYESGKVGLKSAMLRFQVAEGLHLLLQTVSDSHFRDYYKNLYNGAVDIHGHSFWDATNTGTWTKEMVEGFNNKEAGQGFQTFIMGATGGMFMTPIHTLLAAGQSRIMGKMSKQYKAADEYRKDVMKENLRIANAFYKDPHAVLNTHVDAIKAAGKATDNAGEALKNNNHYAFTNAKNDAFAKTVSTFIKNGNYESFLYTLESLSDMSEKDFYDALPNLKPVDHVEGTPLPSPKSVIEKMVSGISEYYNRWQGLKDKYSGLIRPEYFEGRGAKALKTADEKRIAAHEALNEEYKDVKVRKEDIESLSEEEQAKNEQKIAEWNAKADEVEKAYDNETKGNQYYQQLMKKRALDEAIEVAATMGHHANEAVKNMIELQGKMMNPGEVGEGIAKHGSAIVNVLGDKKATVKEIARLRAAIKTLVPLETGAKDVVTKDIQKQKEAYEQQLEHLLAWQAAFNAEESHAKLSDEEKAKLTEIGDRFSLPDRAKNIEKLQDAFKGYIQALNSEVTLEPMDISTDQYYKALDYLTQHMNYRKDHHDYMDAINVLADPRNFQKLYNRIYDGMEYAMFDRYIKERKLIALYDTAMEAGKQQQEEENKREQLEKEAKEKEQAEEHKRIAEMQKLKLSELIPEVERDIEHLEAERKEIERLIDEANAKLPAIENDLEAARELLKEDPNKSAIRREFRRIEQSLRGKANYAHATIQRLTERKDTVQRAIDSLNVMKENYSRAIEELEKEGKPIEVLYSEEEMNQQFGELQGQELTKKYAGYKLDYAIQETKDELDILNERIAYFQKVVDACEGAINDIAIVLGNKEPEGRNGKPGPVRYGFEAEMQGLIEKFENYSKDLAEAKTLRDQVQAKYDRLFQTRQAREGMEAISKKFEYLNSIKDALEKQKEEPAPNQPLAGPEPVTEKGKKERLEKTKKELVENAISGTELSAEAKEDLAKSKDLQALVEDIKAEVEEVNGAEYPSVSGAELTQLKAERIEEIKAKAEADLSQALDEHEEFITHPEIHNFPNIREEKGDYRISFPADKFGNGSFSMAKTIGEKGARQAINKFIEQETEKRYPKIEGSKFRRGQYIYNKEGERFVIIGNAHPKTGMVNIQNEAGGVLNVKNTELDGKFTDSRPDNLQYNPVEAQAKIEENREHPVLYNVDGEWTTNDPNKINYDDINSITVFQKDKGKSTEEPLTKARERFLNFLVENGITDLNETELTLSILKNHNSGTYNFTKNNNVRVVKSPVSYGVNIKTGNKSWSIFLMANGAAYEFQIWPDHWVKAEDLTQEQFFEFFNPPTSFYTNYEKGVSESELFKQFKNDIAKVSAFTLEMSKYKEGHKLTESEVQELVSLKMVPHLNYSGMDKTTGEIKPESDASEVTQWDGQPQPQRIVFEDGTEGHSIIINNGADFMEKPFIAGWGDAASLEESAIFAQAPANSRYPGMYSMLHQLPTGQLIWVQLKPKLMTEAEVNERLVKAGALMAGVSEKAFSTEEEANAEIEGGSKPVNDILKQIFIPFNVYNRPGEIDYSQKWSIRLRAVRAEEDTKMFKKGDWHITMMMEETFGLPSEREKTALVLPNVLFDSADAFAESINATLHEKNRSGDPKHPLVSHLEVDPTNFRHQVFRDDINSVMQMATNLSVENGSVVKNMNVNWTFKGDAQQILKDSQPQETNRVYKGDKTWFDSLPPSAQETMLEKQAAREAREAVPARVFNIDRASEKLLKTFGITKDEAGVWHDNKGVEVDPEEKLHVIQSGSMEVEGTSMQEELEMPTNNPQSLPDVSDLEGIFNESKGQQRSRRARKIVGAAEKFDALSLENIDKFTAWVNKNLPTGIISVENLGILSDNLKNQNVTVGTFYSYMEGVNQVGKISLYENSPYKYHEAFHAVFRLLLPEQRIQELLREAKKENPLTAAKLEAFRNKGYAFSDAEVADRFAEEHLADRFQEWKQGRKEANTAFGRFFQYIADLFRELFAKLGGNKIEGFFYEVNRGKYRNARLQENSFTGQEGVAITQPANKAIWVGTQMINGKEVDRFLPQQVADRLSASIAGMFLQKLDTDPTYQKTGKYNKDTILNSIMDQYEELLNPISRREFYEEQAKKIKDPEARKQWYRDLVDRYNVFSTYEDKEGKVLNQSRQEMKESVDRYLQIMGLKQKLGEEKMEEDELEDGILSTEKLERESAFSLGGFGSLPTIMRRFIGTTTFSLEELGQRSGKFIHDEFFNTKFLNGEDIVQAVDANKVYNGMLKALSNSSDVDTLMRKLMRFIDEGENPETSKFIQYIMENTGFDPVVYKDSNGTISGTKNENILQQVVKAFNQYTVNTKFIGYDAANQTFKISDANTKDAAFYQVSNWQNAFDYAFHTPYIMKSGKEAKAFADAAIKPLQSLKGQLDLINSPITDAVLKYQSKNISSELMDKLGINLHPAYIRYSILKSKMKADGEKQILTPEQLDFVNSYPLVSEIQSGPIANIVKQLQSEDKNIFVKDEKGAKTSYQSLNFMADGNAMFDENINMISHKNAEGENVTNFVQPFYSGVAVTDMNKGMSEWMKGLPAEMQKEVANNPLLSDPNFRYMMDKGMLSVEFIDGMRDIKGFDEKGEWIDTYEDDNGNIVEGHWEETGSKARRDREKEGKTYADFSDRDFIASLFSFYNVVGQSDVTVVKGGDMFYKIAVPIRVPAEKSMFALIKLPVIHSVMDDGKGGNKLTDRAFRILYNRVEEEFNSIKECYESLANGEPEGHARIEGWNTDDLRGTKFFQTSMMLGHLREVIETKAKDEKDFKLDSMKDEIRDQLNKYFLGKDGQVQKMTKRMMREEMMDQYEGEYANEVFGEAGTRKGLLPDYLFEGFTTYSEAKGGYVANTKLNDELFLQKGNFLRNMAQVYMNSFLNTSLVNNLLHGNESKLYKNMTDAIKRESGTMATGNSIEVVVPAPSMGINKALKQFHHITFSDELADRILPGSNKPLEVDDGHGLTTEKGLLYMLYGKGTLNAVQAALLRKLMNGASITPEEFFGSGGLKSNGAFNSLKMVYNDGQVYLKFSITPLFKELTSYRTKDGTWLPLPGKEEMHDLRERMEKYETDYDTIVVGHPQSASKMLTRNVYNGKDYKGVRDDHFEPLQAKFFKEQLQNPSGKTEIVDPTQPKLQMPAEQNLKTPIFYDGKFTKADGKPLKTVGDMVEFFMENTAQRMSNNFTTARDSIFTIEGVSKDIKESIQANKVTPALGKFLMVAKENLEATGTDAQMLGFMDVDANGVPKYNINFPSLLPKITSIFFSYFSKGVLREKVPGMSLAIVSPAHGLGTVIKEVKSIWTQKDINKYKVDQKLLGQPREWTVIPMKEFKRNPAKFKDLIRWDNADGNKRMFSGLEKKLKDNGSVFVIDDIRDNYLKFKNDKAIGYYSEALRPAHNEEEMVHGFTDENKYGFGTRIPYVDKNNATSFEFVDQLPVQMGSVMVVPREYYERTGADNDIDKDYVSVHDTYTNAEGQRIAYGSAKSADEKFNEFVQFTVRNNKAVKTNLQHLMSEDPEVAQIRAGLTRLTKQQRELHEQYLDNLWLMNEPTFEGDNKLFKQADREIKQAKGELKGLKAEERKKLMEVRDRLIIEAMRQAKLPVTTSEFMKAGGEKLNNGVLNNRVLDAKIAMLNNESTVKNQNTPTTTDPLKMIVKELVGELQGGKSEYCQQILDMMQEKNVDVNSILAMVNDRSATMMGASSIGSVATANIVYSFLNQMKRTLRNNAITIDGHTFDSFAETFAWDKETNTYKANPATRIFAALGCLTNTMTDNPKERNANKLNLGRTATGFAAYLLATGMPEKTAYLYMIQPSTLKYMEMKKGGVLQLEGDITSAPAFLRDRIAQLEEDGIEEKAGGLTTQDLIDNIRNGGEDASIELSILKDLQKMEKQSETYFKVAKVIRLTQGVKGDMENFDSILSDLHDLGIIIENGDIRKMTDEEFATLDTAVDLRDALLNDHKFISNALHAIKQLDAAMPSMFIERTKLFRDMTMGAKASLVAPSQAEMDKFNRDIKYDLLGYIAVRAYKHMLDSEEKNNTLNQGLIYSGQGMPTIVEMARDVKNQLEAATRSGVNNYLLSYFLVPNEASEKTAGLNVLEANTWAQLSEIQQERLIASYVDLYQDAYKKHGIFTHDLANAMFNYLLVKDGGQFTNGSFIRMLPPFIFKDIMDKIGAANELMKGGKGSYEELFGKGVTQQSMLTDFMKGYTTHVANRRFILQVERPKSKFEPSRAEAQHSQAFQALSLEDKRRVMAHNNVKGASIIFQKNQELTVNALGGIRSFEDNKSGKFDAAEKVMLMDNKEHLDQIGFNKAKGGIIFPVSFQYNNRLYTLQEVYKMDESEGKWKPVMRDVFITAGEFAPTGLKAKYVEHKWEGSVRQFPAASAAGPVPAYQATEKEMKKIAKDNKAITDQRVRVIMVKEGYREKPYDTGKKGPSGSAIMGQRVEDKDGNPVLDNAGKPIGNLVKAWEVLEARKQQKDEGTSQEEVSEEQTPSGPSVEKLQQDWAKELAALKKKYPVLPSSPKENAGIREKGEADINAKYKKLIDEAKGVTSQPKAEPGEKLVGGVFSKAELNAMYEEHAKAKGEKKMAPAQWKNEVMEYLAETTTESKEEMIRKIKCL